VERLGFRVGTWNIDSLTGRACELVEVLADREVDVGCIQETRWRGSGCRFFGAQGKRYKLFWMGGRDRSDGVGTFVAEKWVDSVVEVERYSESVDTEDGLGQQFDECSYGVRSSLGKTQGRKRKFLE